MNTLDTEPLTPALPRDAASPCVDCDVRLRAICAVLSDDELYDLSRVTHSNRYDAGSTLFFEGDEVGDYFIVQHGALKLYKLMADGRRQITGFLFKGDFIGLNPTGEHQYTAETLTPCEVCRLPAAHVKMMVHDYPKLCRRLLNLASMELASAQEQMLLLGRKSARERIASFLLWLSARARDRGEVPNPVHVPMSRSDMGDYLGLTVETVSRTITKLKTSGLITLRDGHRIELNNRELLAEVASGG